MSDPVAAFLTARPHYNPRHVAEIQAACAKEGIPFCSGCADWHFPEQGHSN